MQSVQAERQIQSGQVDIDDLYDENLATMELKSFITAVYDGKIGPQDYAAERLKMNFRRGPDGRVELRSRQGRWYGVKPDAEVPGYLLLRDVARGDVFALPPDEGDGIVQYDLADDVVVAQLFSTTAWQDVMQPIMLRAAGGSQEQLQMSAGQFRVAFSILEGAEEELDAIPEQQAEDGGALQPAQ